MTNIEFEASINLILKNDKSGLEKIYLDYVTPIYFYILSIVKNKETAEDLTADFFIKLWLKADTYNFKGSHKSWIMTMARNLSIDYLRKNKNHITLDSLDNCFESPSLEPKIHSKLLLEELFLKLKDNEREIVLLHLLSDLTFKEISKTLKKPLGTVAWQYNSAIKKLRRFHNEEF